jgi:phosphoglycolate phosphatase
MKGNKRYELVVFDWDGTLMNSEVRIVTCMQLAAADTGFPVPADETARDIIGLGLTEAVERLFPAADEKAVDALINAYRGHWLGSRVASATMFKGALDLISGLHRGGYLLAVATGKSRQGLDKALDESGLSAFFHATRCADETFSKPHPQMLEEILTDLDVSPADTLMIGDTEYDMQMARCARVDAIGVSHGVHAVERLFEQGALRCFDDLIQLAGWLDQPSHDNTFEV